MDERLLPIKRAVSCLIRPFSSCQLILGKQFLSRRPTLECAGHAGLRGGCWIPVALPPPVLLRPTRPLAFERIRSSHGPRAENLRTAVRSNVPLSLDALFSLHWLMARCPTPFHLALPRRTTSA